MSAEEGYTHFIQSLTNIIDACAHEKEIIIKNKYYQRQMDDPWINEIGANKRFIA